MVEVDWVREHADWIMQAVMPDGAIAKHVDHEIVRPYEAHFAAWGLVRATAVTEDQSYIKAAWNWLDWYYRHMDEVGFVTDYDLKDGQLVSTQDMDSTDSYAAMFLVAYNAARKVSNDTDRTNYLRPAVAKAVNAIEATMDSDGLTWAKPGWPIKYLMDMSEVYLGLEHGIELAEYFEDKELFDRISRNLAVVARGIENLWDENTQTYYWAVHMDGTRTGCDWQVLYPDALEQVWPVAFGVICADRAAHLLVKFEDAHPNWDRPDAQYVENGVTKTYGYWPAVAWAFQKVGYVDRAMKAAARIREGALKADRKWPYNVIIAGEQIILESGGF